MIVMKMMVFVSAMSPAMVLADQVTCQSNSRKQTECSLDARDGVHLKQQLSKTRCVEGQNWGSNRRSVWVKDGCRAIFVSNEGHSNGGGYGASSGGADRVTCQSNGSKKAECEMNTRGTVKVERQLSRTRCVEGRNWGLSKHNVWVSGGCRAVFVNTSVSSGGRHGSSHGSSNDG